LVAHSGKKHNWQHILGKNLTDSISGKKTYLAGNSGEKYDWQHIVGKTKIVSTLYGKKHD
jgi:hypothetical protein